MSGLKYIWKWISKVRKIESIVKHSHRLMHVSNIRWFGTPYILFWDQISGFFYPIFAGVTTMVQKVERILISLCVFQRIGFLLGCAIHAHCWGCTVTLIIFIWLIQLWLLVEIFCVVLLIFVNQQLFCKSLLISHKYFLIFRWAVVLAWFWNPSIFVN
jgi:hypothetical protein